MPPEQTPQPQEKPPFNFWETDPKKNFTPWFLTFCIVLVIIGLAITGYFKYKAYQSYKEGPALETQIKPPTNEFTGWQTYRNEEYEFEFMYPPNLTLLKDNEEVVLHHQIPYENNGDCDMVGGDNKFPYLTDFKLSFRIIPGEARLDFTDGDYAAGALNGVWVYGGPEGCGITSYYFEDTNKTLVVERDNIQALSGISGLWNQEEILKVPEVISKEENAKLFDQILSTFKFTK